MARCNDCSKFVSFDQGEAELCYLTVELVGDRIHVTGECRLILTCSECSTEMAEANVSFDEDFDAEELLSLNPNAKHVSSTKIEKWAKLKDLPSLALMVEDENSDNTDRYDGTGPMRYRKHFWGALVVAEVVGYDADGNKRCYGEVEFMVEEQASNFESLQ